MKKPTRAERLAAGLLRDRARTSQVISTSMDCFLCGRSFVYKGPQGPELLSGRFCSDRHRDNYDIGARARRSENNLWSADWNIAAGVDPGYIPKTKVQTGPTGFYINCANCGRRFESKGLRCCSVECERKLGEKRENVAIMAEVDMELSVVKRKCEKCGANIPIWHNGRRVSKRRKFCFKH